MSIENDKKFSGVAPRPDPAPAGLPPPEEIEVRRGTEPPLRASLHRPAGEPRGLVLLLHGFKGFRDWGFFPFFATRLAAAGFATATPDFSCNGIGDHRGLIERLDLFEQNALSTEVADVQALRSLLLADPRLRSVPLALIGHSRGGAVALLAAESLEETRAVVGVAPVADFALRFSAEEWQRARLLGRLPVTNARTGQVLHVGRRLLEEMRDPSGRFDPLRAAARLRAPVLLLHGTEDEAVSPEESRRIAAARGELPTVLRMLAGTGHTLDAIHPFAGETPALAAAIGETIEFLTTHLGAPGR